jgi:hypothetical protein
VVTADKGVLQARATLRRRKLDYRDTAGSISSLMAGLLFIILGYVD